MFIYSIGQDKKSQEECKMEWERVDLRAITSELEKTWDEIYYIQSSINL